MFHHHEMWLSYANVRDSRSGIRGRDILNQEHLIRQKWVQLKMSHLYFWGKITFVICISTKSEFCLFYWVHWHIHDRIADKLKAMKH